MHKLIRLVALLLAMALFASACGGDGEGDDVAAESSTTTTTEAVTTTTEAVSSTTTETTTTTTEVPDLGPTYPLSGVPIGESDPADHAAVVVKVSNNDVKARAALIGLDKADIVYEERIEQQATRFASVYHSVLPDEIGSVRSGRTSDIDIVSNLNRPVFGYSGANDGVSAQLRQAENEGLLIRSSADFGHSEFRRITGVGGAPNNLVADASALVDRADGGEPPSPVFDYSNNVTELGAPSLGVRIEARTDAFFAWSAADGGYRRYHDNTPHMTRDGVQITPVNVVVLSTTYLPSQIDRSSVDAVTVGSGNVFVYSGGYRLEGTWTREFARDPYTLTTPEGEVIGLAPGQTWVSLTPGGTSIEISADAAETLLGS